MDEAELEQISMETNHLNYGFSYKEIYRDPNWRINENSKLLQVFKNVYYSMNQEYPKEKICHGSIECSSINKKIDNLDIISIGSKMRYFHTTKEVTYISSWLKTYYCLVKVLESIE